MVRRAHAESVEQAAGVERVFGGKCECGSGGMRGICLGDRNTGVNLFAFYTVRMYRVAAYFWFCTEDWRDGAELDYG